MKNCFLANRKLRRLQLYFLACYRQVLADEGLIPEIRVDSRDVLILQYPQVALERNLHIAWDDAIELVDAPLWNGLDLFVMGGHSVGGLHGDHADVPR
jgi:hypothetical protein